MILILSEILTVSSLEVVRYIKKLGGEYLLLTAEDFFSELRLEFTSKGPFFYLKNKAIDINQINVVWYWRWNYNLFANNRTANNEAYFINNINEINNYVKLDVRELSEFFFDNIKAKWINTIKAKDISKLEQLKIAKEVGFEIPETIITTSKKTVLSFIDRTNEVITKPLRNSFQLKVDEETTFKAYTSIVNKEDILSLNINLTPSLFQEKIEKKIEIRTFYFEGDIFSMAIFSQEDEQTNLDFRKYNYKKPNRKNVYNLPNDINNKIKLFAKKANLGMGSFDLIYTKDNRYIFLEVNPIGQFGMVSYPCNFGLEEFIAKILIKYDSV